ncbi:acyl-CoA dehydrogenase [Microbacterium sp. RD1]|uniref:acyl-CoA dehydrogenase n=1 Tax=Microbacterium sp. RD1 TaxID=3457313 RepID=UPI003FA59166
MPASAADYRPPVEDYQFLFGQAFGRDLLAQATGGELTAQDGVEIVAAAGDFASSVLAPLQDAGDREGARLEDGQVHLPAGFAEAYRAFVEAGWITAEAPVSAGGDGLPGAVRAGLGEIWNASNAAFALCWLLTAGQIHALDAVASEEIRRRYLTKLVSGEWTGTMNLTEPEAGTDLGAIRTIATPRPDGSWGLRGQKIFITWGDHDVADNIVHLVLARTPDAPAGGKGLSLFVVPKFLVNDDETLGERNAVTTVAIEHKLGIHGSPTCVLSYEDATGYLVGELHGGLAGMFVMMNSARSAMGFQATGIADRAYQKAVDYAAERIQGRVLDRAEGTSIAEHPDVQRLLQSMSSKIFAMRAVAVYATDLFDRTDDADARTLAELFVPIVKGWSTEEAQRITSDAIQVCGGMGFIEETGIAQHYRDVRITTIYEGTTAIQANDLLGRKVLRNGGATVDRLLAEIDETTARLRAAEQPVATRTAERLDRAVGATRRATADLLAFGATRDAYAVAVPYLLQLGTLAGGWMHGLAVVAALADTTVTPDAARLESADFYGAHHLPAVHALAETVAAGEVA